MFVQGNHCLKCIEQSIACPTLCKHYYCKLLKWITAYQPSIQLEQVYDARESTEKPQECTLHAIVQCSCTMCASSAMSAASTEESQEAWQLVSSE